MIPENLPVETNPGGFFNYTGGFVNNSADPQTADVWIMLKLPGGSIYGPIRLFNNITLSNPYQIIRYDVRQDIPLFAPDGTYEYRAYCGDYPSNAVDSAFFEFTVTGSPVSGEEGGWILSGWFEETSPADIGQFSLLSNYPNPFNAVTTINYLLPHGNRIRLEVINLMGQKLATLVDSYVPAGSHSINWDGSRYSSGIYYYRFSAGEKTVIRRMTLIK